MVPGTFFLQIDLFVKNKWFLTPFFGKYFYSL